MDSMDSKLIEVWQTAAGNPFLPTIGKGTQFLVAFSLLLLGLSAFAIFALSKSIGFPSYPSTRVSLPKLTCTSYRPVHRRRARHWYPSLVGHRVRLLPPVYALLCPF